ncbi:hypothetical protein [uncultured Roseobacter sp.]|uniref:hypothetical protein n=1 Tax=uncultured Roseobacter sp. TaxID=114847 RepID=UPI002621CC9C|nr:hypothetical protein [uncultured Roseobacter sp.]
MLLRYLAFAAFFLCATSAKATQSQTGDWAAVRMGNQCFVYTQRAASHTSGTLIFSFDPEGFNAAFHYQYTAWPGETEAPWDEDDAVLLEVDGAEIWLGEEMFKDYREGRYVVELTAGFVPDMVLSLLGATDSVSVALDRTRLGETWVYGLFSASGFRETLTQAAEWCSFDPHNLPTP